MCNQPSSNGPGVGGINGISREHLQEKIGSITEDFRGNVIDPKKPFFLKSGPLFIVVQRSMPPPPRGDFIRQMKKPDELKIHSISLSENREPWHGFKDIQEASNYLWAAQRFCSYMAIRIVEVKEVHASRDPVKEKWEDTEDCRE